MAKPARQDAHPRAHYTDATDRTFRRALDALKPALPNHHSALLALVEAGRFDDLESLMAVFGEGQR